jgi:hypothetical protein
MSFLSRFFSPKPERKAGGGDLDTRLQRLENEAGNASPGYVGTSFNRAGDLARREGQLGRAVTYYGRAIDAFLEDAQREAARGVANKIIRVRPDAVRTLCTLTWLDLSAGHSATALMHLRDYIEAATASARQSLAASQIYEMARIVPDSEFIAAAADALDQLDFTDEAAEVREWVGTSGSPNAIADPGALAQACLGAAVRSNERGTIGHATDAPISGGRDAAALDDDAAPGPDDDDPASGPDAVGDADTGAEEARPRKKYRWD